MTATALVGLVTGGASGIGRATAMAMANEGVAVIIADLDLIGAEVVVAAIVELGGQARAMRCDVTAPEDCDAMVDLAVTTFGRIDWAVNAAGYPGKQGRLLEWETVELDRCYEINTKGVWHSMRSELRQMLAQGGGSIVNIASVGGLLSAQSMSGYSASKHAVVGLTQTAACEYARDNIRVNAVCPGSILTPMLKKTMEYPGHAERVKAVSPMGRIGEPHEIADCAVFLCSQRASYVTGVAFPVDGGVMAKC